MRLPRSLKPALIFLMLVCLPYCACFIYEFPSPVPFAGDELFNPYVDTVGVWLKANFHGHGSAWSGLTEGRYTYEDYYRTYTGLGYDIIGISNYHRIESSLPNDSLYVPIYEHGYNLQKIHRLCIGTSNVIWFDYPLWQTNHHKQFLIDLIKPSVEVLAMAHPKFSRGFPPDDLAQLTGYDCIEVLNHYRVSDKHWDAALSAGRLPWIVGNDDTHNIENPEETGRFWTMIRARPRNPDDALRALRKGNAYGVAGNRGFNDIRLESVGVLDLTMEIRCNMAADEIRFIGQNGIIKAILTDTSAASYTFMDDDTYIRTVVEASESILYLNPVVRSNGTPHKLQANIDWTLSLLYWVGFAIVYGSAGSLIIRPSKRRHNKT